MGSIVKDVWDILVKFFQWWVIVNPWESAIRVRRGKKITTHTGRMVWKLPIIDQVFKQSVRWRICDLPVQTLTTPDDETVTLKGMLGYEIRNIQKLYETLHHAEDTVVNLAEAAIAKYVTSHDSNVISVAGLESFVNDALDLSRYGLSKVKCAITDFAYVRAIRLITDSDWYKYGDSLQTNEQVVNN